MKIIIYDLSIKSQYDDLCLRNISFRLNNNSNTGVNMKNLIFYQEGIVAGGGANTSWISVTIDKVI